MAAFIGPILTGVSALAGLFGGKKQQQITGTQTTSGAQTSNQQFNGTNTSTPNLSPIQQKLVDLFTAGSINQFQHPQDLTDYKNAGLQAINQQSDITNKAVGNMLASRGLSFSPAAATAQTQGLINQGNQQTNFLESLPLLQRQFQQENIRQLLSSFGAIPTGQTQTQSGTSSGTSTIQGKTDQTATISGNPLAGLFGGAGAGLAAWLPQLFNNNGNQGGYTYNQGGPQ